MSNSKQPTAMISVGASPEVRDWLKTEAEKHFRSMSAQAALLLSAAMAAQRRAHEVANGNQG